MAVASLWRMLLALCFAMLLPWQFAAAQQLQPVPTLTARVMDQSGTLNAQQTAAIEARLRDIEEKSGSQVVVLMVSTTSPEDIAPFAHRVASTWKIGRKEVGDGLLIVVAKDDRRMRIEVARALEGAIPDLAASRIIEQHMVPHFRQNDYAGGILAALDQVGARIAGEQLPAPGTPSRNSSQGIDLESLAIFLFFGVMVVGPIIRRIFGNKLGSAIVGGGAGLLAFLLTSSLLLALAAGVIALLVTLFANISGGGGGPYIGGGGFGGGRGGGFGGGGFGGGFSSGGGGSFGGGGASGSW
ncbi:TPM domain-containing protein [Comamonas sp. NoAH]|uniref:TPM domain-containing protein n=1 Tax=Comamonas halotolerans TaxID=3041496 RepID=UPI0024E0E53F|nr:YgcG family protein [Comamonas sp. NoAH]